MKSISTIKSKQLWKKTCLFSIKYSKPSLESGNNLVFQNVNFITLQYDSLLVGAVRYIGTN